jgi:Glycosyltransferase
MLVSRNLPPLVGGMERLNWHIAAELAREHDVLVVGPKGSAALAPADVEITEVPLRPLWKFLLAGLRTARREAVRWRPDIVLAGSGLTAPIAYVAARACGARTAVYVHGLDIIVDHRVYRWLWLPVLRRFDSAIANSANTADMARRAGVAGGRISVVHPGTSLAPMHAVPDRQPAAALDPAEGHILLSVGRLTERKGLAQFITHAMPTIIAEHPSARLVVVGDDAPNALRKGASDQVGVLLAAIESAGMQRHVLRRGPCSDDELTRAYERANVHVFPVRHVPGDVEGFGMVAIEAAAHGVPTVAFAVGGVPDAVSDGVSGYLVSPGDYAAFASRVNHILAGSDEALKAGSRQFAREFAWEKFGERIRAALAAPPVSDPGDSVRQGHAVLDLGSRVAKAKKIEVLLGLAPGSPLRLLEVGTGSGGIAHYFGTHPVLDIEVEAVDVQDARQIFEGYRFTRVEGVELPFPDGHFDVVVSNHVIEHVGDATAQAAHLDELRRVMRPGGVCYLAVPNRWMIVEPHYRLAFLSWWPERWRSGWLRFWRRGEHYDCLPLSRGGLEEMLALADLQFEQLHGEALQVLFEIEKPESRILRFFLRRVPRGLYDAIGAMFPTLIYRVWRH